MAGGDETIASTAAIAGGPVDRPADLHNGCHAAFRFSGLSIRYLAPSKSSILGGIPCFASRKKPLPFLLR